MWSQKQTSLSLNVVTHENFRLENYALYHVARAVRQTGALASVIFFVFSVIFFPFNTLNTYRYLGREFNHGHCLSHNFFLATSLVGTIVNGDESIINDVLLCICNGTLLYGHPLFTDNFVSQWKTHILLHRLA